MKRKCQSSNNAKGKFQTLIQHYSLIGFSLRLKSECNKVDKVTRVANEKIMDSVVGARYLLSSSEWANHARWFEFHVMPNKFILYFVSIFGTELLTLQSNSKTIWTNKSFG